MYLSEQLQKKWEGVLDHPELAPIKDPYKKAVTAVVLENQAQEMQKAAGILTEAGPTNSMTNTVASGGFGGSASSPVAGFDPILISLVRRSLPNLIAYDIAGVQPMTGPTGLIFAMRSRYGFSGGATAAVPSISLQSDTAATGNVFANTLFASLPNTMTTGKSEALGDGASNVFQEMAFSIEKVTVTARSRALKAEYSMELAQDLKAVILAEINREVIRTIYATAKVGAQVGTTKAGTFDLDTDSNGRWMVEKVKGLAFQIEREANTIAKTTRRGKGNIMICSSDVASALAMAGILDYNSALASNVSLTVDDTGNTFAGTLFGRIKVYIDPYFPTSSTSEFAVVGYKGSNAYDAGLFYCPYVPLQMVRAVDTGTFQPKIGFKTRYGLVANPFAEGTTVGSGTINVNSNVYYRAFKISNLM